MFKTIDDMPSLTGQRVLVRVDLNVPLSEGAVSDFTRIDRILPTVTDLTNGGAKVILLSHFGRPKGTVKPEMSLKPIADAVAARLGKPVTFADDCIGPAAAAAITALENGGVLVLENLRFNAGEEANDMDFAAQLAANGDAIVSDAFSCAHRAHASVEAVTRLLPTYAGRNMQSELDALNAALGDPKRPVAAIVGGAKVSTKLDVLTHLVEKVDVLVIGGGMANTFLHAQGVDVGKSLCEADLADTARDILKRADKANCQIVLPTDGLVAHEFKAHAAHKAQPVNQTDPEGMILDAGPDSIDVIKAALAPCKTVVWNGPLGAFEIAPFDTATNAVAQAVAAASTAGQATSVAGGGDTVAALSHAGVLEQFSYVSTAGGAFLEWLEGRTLPGVAALSQQP